MQQVHGCMRTIKIDLWTLHRKYGLVLMYVEVSCIFPCNNKMLKWLTKKVKVHGQSTARI